MNPTAACQWGAALYTHRPMSRFAIIAAAGVLAASCGLGKSKIRAGDGQHCTTSSSEDPVFTCSPAYDLACIATYKHQVSNEPVYVCRLVCTPGDRCLYPSDICCPGTIHGKTYGKMHACVPVRDCDLRPDAGVTPDSGTPDTAADVADDAAVDASDDSAQDSTPDTVDDAGDDAVSDAPGQDQG